jgi:hypothetical protein
LQEKGRACRDSFGGERIPLGFGSFLDETAMALAQNAFCRGTSSTPESQKHGGTV